MDETAGEIDPRCICGSTDIEHAYDMKWLCNGCGRFHDAKAMDRMSDADRGRRKTMADNYTEVR